MWKKLLFIALASWTVLSYGKPAAQFKLHKVFGSHMVLQSSRPIVISGTAEPGSTLEVAFAGERIKSTADNQGEWQAKFPALKPGKTPYTLEVSGAEGAEKIRLEDILIGEVWFCSGQSNMQMPVYSKYATWRMTDAENEVKKADYPLIRLWQGKSSVSPFQEQSEPQGGSWKVCSPKTIAAFSAAAYCFGRELYKELQIPVGLIHASLGGTRIQPWISPDMINQNPDCRPEKAMREKFETEKNSVKPHQFPGTLYNSMVAPWTRVAIRGVIWYQGCANAGDARYYGLHKALIRDWRNKFHNPDMPFILVQLAGYATHSPQNRPPEDTWKHEVPKKCPKYAFTREIQTALLQDPKVGMAVAMDVGDQFDIHPRDKQTLGIRLCAEAMRVAYGKTGISQGPKFRKCELQNGKMRVYFDNVGKGLTTKDGKTPGAFALKDAAGKLFWAEAVIDGDTVVVSSPAVPHPAAVRYAFCGYRGDVNLMNKDGFAAIPFRSDAPKY